MGKHGRTKRVRGAAAASAAAFALTAAFGTVPAYAGENLTITIQNNEGLPAMTDDQFAAYQLFAGEASAAETPENSGAERENTWEAEQWPDAFLSDIRWGSGVTDGGANLTSDLSSLAYDPDTPWPEFFNTEAGNANYFADVSSAKDVASVLSGKDNALMQAFANFVTKGKAADGAGYLNDSGKVLSDVTAGQATTDTALDDESAITLTEQGYYLVIDNGDHSEDHGAVSEYILAVLGSQTIKMKASVPTVTKTIDLSDNSEKGDVAGVGDEVAFMLTATLPKNFPDYDSYKFVFHDTLAKGLTYGSLPYFDDVEQKPVPPNAYASATITRDDIVYALDEMEFTYTSPDGTLPEGETNITFEFEDLRKANGLQYTTMWRGSVEFPGNGHIELQPGDILTVMYTATVNENAVTGYGEDGAGNLNTVYLQYSNDPNDETKTGKTPIDLAHVYTFGLDLKKVGDDDAHKDGLEGAGFTLTYGRKEDDDQMIATFEDGQDGERVFKGFAVPEDEGGFYELYDTYTAAEEAFDKASEADRKEGGEAYQNLHDALDALKPYLLVSGSDGRIPAVKGLDENAYYDPAEMPGDAYTITEVVTPDGYDTMAPFTVRIDATLNEETGLLEQIDYYNPADGDTPKTYKNDPDGGQAVFQSGLLPEEMTNAKSPFLPNTGGTGVQGLLLLGMLTAAAGLTVTVSARKRRA